MDEHKLKLWEQIKHFHSSEFDSPDLQGSGAEFMNMELIFMLDKLRDFIKMPIHISSGYRTPEHNMKVGKTLDSAHTRGLAVDIPCDSSSDRWKLVFGAEKVGFRRIECAPKHIHLDIDFSKPQEVLFYPPK